MLAIDVCLGPVKDNGKTFSVWVYPDDLPLPSIPEFLLKWRKIPELCNKTPPSDFKNETHSWRYFCIIAILFFSFWIQAIYLYITNGTFHWIPKSTIMDVSWSPTSSLCGIVADGKSNADRLPEGKMETEQGMAIRNVCQYKVLIGIWRIAYGGEVMNFAVDLFLQMT